MKKKIFIATLIAICMFTGCEQEEATGGSVFTPEETVQETKETVSIEETITETNSGDETVSESFAWQSAYVEQIKECNEENPDYTYSLAYINWDDTPELVVDDSGYELSIYTYTEDGDVVLSFDHQPYGVGGCVSYCFNTRENYISYLSQNGPTDFGYYYMSMNEDGIIEDNYSLSAVCYDENGEIAEEDPGEDGDWHYTLVMCGSSEEIAEDKYITYFVDCEEELIGEYSFDEMNEILGE